MADKQDDTRLKAQSNQADNRSEAIKAMSEIPLPWNAVYAPPKHIADVSDLVLKDPEATDE